MTEAVAQILAEIQRLSPPDRADLADNIVETLIDSTPPEVERAQLDEVRRRIAEAESGAGDLFRASRHWARVRRLVASARVAS